MGRLIDADVLIENLREIKTLYGVPMTNRDEQMIHWIIGHIKEQPTAYDVEKVVEQLEDLEEDFCQCFRKCEEQCFIQRVTDIVRKGGVE